MICPWHGPTCTRKRTAVKELTPDQILFIKANYQLRRGDPHLMHEYLSLYMRPVPKDMNSLLMSYNELAQLLHISPSAVARVAMGKAGV